MVRDRSISCQNCETDSHDFPNFIAISPTGGSFVYLLDHFLAFSSRQTSTNGVTCGV